MVIPRFVDQALRGLPLTVYGDGTQSRCFCDVADVVPAIIGLAEHPESHGKAFNVGGTESVSMRALAELVRDILGSQSEITHVTYEEAYATGFEDMARREPDIGRIRALLGWQLTIPLDETIRRTTARAEAPETAA